MSKPIIGFWKRPSDTEEQATDYLWIGENGRIVHRINYKHGPFVMTLWSARVDGDIYEVKLKPKSEAHRLILASNGDILTMEHLDLTNPKAEFVRITPDEVSDSFGEDLTWADRTMDKLEQNSENEE